MKSTSFFRFSWLRLADIRKRDLQFYKFLVVTFQLGQHLFLVQQFFDCHLGLSEKIFD